MLRGDHKQTQEKELELSANQRARPLKKPALVTPRSWRSNLQNQDALHFYCLSLQTETLSQETNMLIVRVLHSVASSRNKRETCET